MMTVNQMIEHLERYRDTHGDAPMVYEDSALGTVGIESAGILPATDESERDCVMLTERNIR